MHSHDRTLISQLGFNDPDKKNPEHDLACQYLSSERIAKKLFSQLRRSREPENCPPQIELAEVEKHLTKGEGQYRSTIGFLDCVLTARVWFEGEHPMQGAIDKYYQTTQMVIEVKINKCSIGDIIRQINLYKTYLSEKWSRVYVLATRYQPSVSEIEMLEKQGIRHIVLGKGFDEWMKEAARDESKLKPRSIEM